MTVGKNALRQFFPITLHFASVGHKTTDYIHHENNFEKLLGDPEGDAGVYPIPAIESFDMYQAMRNTKAGWKIGAVGVPDRLLKDFAVLLAKPLTVIFNLSRKTRVFPERLRDTKVIPLYKRKGHREDAANYRPIALVDYLSKVFERLVRET